MSWTFLGIVVLAHVLAILVLRNRQAEQARMKAGLAAIQDAKATGSHKARLQYPHIDRSNCIGCATCIAACPEEGVLDLVHGQAMVVHGARCVGCGNCATECPVGAIALTLGDVSDRDDLPVVTEEWESNRVRGLFLGGEVTGYALIRTAIEHGKAIANVVAERLREQRVQEESRRRRRQRMDAELKASGAVADRGFWARLSGKPLDREPGKKATAEPASPPRRMTSEGRPALGRRRALPRHSVDRPKVQVIEPVPAPVPAPLPASLLGGGPRTQPLSLRPIGAVATAATSRALDRPIERVSPGSPLDDDDELVVALAPTPGVPTVKPDLIRLDELIGAQTAIFEEETGGIAVSETGGPGDGKRSGDGGSDGGNGDEPPPAPDESLFDLCIVGAGPAGLAASLQARARGLNFVTLEREALGGTVTKYPRKKLVMTQPVELPLYGELSRSTYTKEELLQIWVDVVEEHQLPIRTGYEFTGVERRPDGYLQVHTKQGTWNARNVCLALGRRGSPRKLHVPGEELPKVTYSLMDAESYQGRRILVVGGGDSAIEAALGLAAQPGNEVIISYRQAEFWRLKARNIAHLKRDLEQGKLTVLFNSEVVHIDENEVVLDVRPESGAQPVRKVLPNDEVFVMAGGVPPYDLLQKSGVSFDPAERAPEAPLVERGTGLRRALWVSFSLAIGTALWVLFYAGYYSRDVTQRYLSPYNDWLRPTGTVGLTTGIVGTLLVLVNLAYLARRSKWGRRLPGSLRGWMTSHMVTGVLAALLILLHAGMAPANSLGGNAFWALCVLLFTGAIGRYFYAFVPRAANGRELALEEVRNRLGSLSAAWDAADDDFGRRAREEIEQLVEDGRWRGSFVERLGMLLKGQRRLGVTLSRLRTDARAAGLPADEVSRLVTLARSAHRSALMAAHYEDVRTLLNTWRWLHRWVALFMVLMATWHIITALRYGNVF